MNIRNFLTLSVSILLFQTALGDIRLPRLISNGMVLQRDIRVQLWGWAAAGEKVSVTFQHKTYSTVARADSTWKLNLQPLKAGGPYTMLISGNNTIRLANILVGDVWVCGGQSNMELPMERVKEKYAGVIAHAQNSFIRQFNVPESYDFNLPHTDVRSGRWEEANPETIMNFTAVGYFFARALYEKHHVPIGLIKACIGGTPAEAWLSKDALKAFPAQLRQAEKFSNRAFVDSLQNADQHAVKAWYSQVNDQDRGLHEETPWYDPAYPATNWRNIQVPGYWFDQGIKALNGAFWYRKEFDIPAWLSGKPARLLLGRIIDADFTYLNGTKIGEISYQYPPRRYEIPAGILKTGKNVLVVRVISNAGKGGFVPDKPYRITSGNDTMDLKGIWLFNTGTVSGPTPATTTIKYQPGGLYNGMIAPLLNYRIKGVIWYQGESNTAQPKEYYRLFPAVIANWRQKWQQGDFPFLYVQLANFMEVKNQPGESNWAMVRDAQLKTLSVPCTGMAVTIDIGEWNDVHPLNKADVGKRLALAAEKIAYGADNLVFSGPLYKAMRVEGNKVILSFSNTGSGLMAKGNASLNYFAIAGADKKFVWAKAEIHNNQVVVWSDLVAKPVAVRYAWADNPEGANLYNREGLPASPFKTD
ncbi:sialate O-acetylesterase (plasmid) [Pedobacter sp. BS3]|uniref:sialate O-acetylesterase n=1 Tax=Pedobacter sp. BS3 TaxID=2567937 RepID=UPI0011ED66C4|nr:sialate O-acetylesterase [Pedobacter sp. BS3]TZF85602.1 sialate O-acetylesterase [Pedobacter sp. BS3]